MSETLRWWFLLMLAGVVALPLCLAVFRPLADRGYALSKPFGLLFLGYTFWLLNSLGVLPNSRGGIIAALLVLAAVAAAFTYVRRDDLLAWARANWRYVVGIEVAFLVVFLLAVWLRSMVGQIQGTEQPMDLMFVNAATRADTFPPEDPWLSGHQVAYYYFGYLLVAMTGTFAGVPTEIGYNIGFGMIAALTLVAAFGIGYTLVHLRESERDDDAAERAAEHRNWRPYVFGAVGALMLVIMGNLVWALKFASAYGIGGDGFYDWVDVSGLTADEPRETWYPSEFFGFFDASRIYPLNNDDFRVITEFPMFSFLLGDLHPHVMALPFVLLTVGLALALYRSDDALDVAFWLRRPLLLVASALMLGALAFLNTWDIATLTFVIVMAVLLANIRMTRDAADETVPPIAGASSEAPPEAAPPAERSATNSVPTLKLSQDEWRALGVVALLHAVLFITIIITLTPPPLLTFALVAGNVVWFALLASYVSARRTPWYIESVVRTASLAIPLIMLAVVMYIPFYDGFTSQADGILPVVTQNGIDVAGTRPLHAFLYWGPLFAVVLPFVVARILAQRSRVDRRLLLGAAAVPVAVVVGWALLLLMLTWFDNDNVANADGVSEIGERGIAWLTTLAFGAALGAALLALWLELTAPEQRRRTATIFALMLASTAFLLILGTEFFYVNDVFESRMNTVFKLYYQAWLLLALTGGFALYQLAANWRFSFEKAKEYRYAWGGLAAVTLACAALYPLGATADRLQPYNADGSAYEEREGLDGLARFAVGEREAIDWLKGIGQGQDVVIVEAFCHVPDCTGNDYQASARISMATGVPTVLGWAGHEDQWRGGTAEARAGRFEDVERLYKTASMDEVAQIVEKYGIAYIYVGPLERNVYGSEALGKFEELPVAFVWDPNPDDPVPPDVVVYQARAAEGGAEASR